MKSGFRYSGVLTLFFVLAAYSNAKADTSLIKFGTVWKYLDSGTPAPTGAGTADWRNIAFNDDGWPNGPSEFGYGANKERTTINFGGNPASKYITTYFRQTVDIPAISVYHTVRINAYIDDGAVIYVNGTEVARFNITGTPTYSVLASNAPENGNVFTSFDIPAGSFTSGNNIIAVEVHQANAASSDLSFDLELIAKTIAIAEPDIVRGPLLQMASAGAMTIRWTTTAPATSRIKYGTSEHLLASTVSDNANTTDHEMRITGLNPDTKYYYAIGTAHSILKGSYRNYFTTSPPAGTTRKIRIGVFGDPGTGNSIQKSSRDNYIKLKGDYNNSEMVIMLGDNAYNQGLESEHNTGFFNIYNNNVFDNHVVFPVPGNHEYANNGSRAVDHNIPYYSIFTLPASAESGGLASGTEHYYSYDYGNIHFVMLDSYGIDGGNRLYDDTATGQQAVWLKADLAASAGTHKWTIVCLHHPPYTNGTHVSNNESDLVAIRQKITPIWERYGVDVVLAGHSHVYERSFLVKDHTGPAASFNNGTATGGTKLSNSSARYDGSAGSAASVTTPFDSSAANASCPYFTIDSLYKHGTVYVVAGSAGQVFSTSVSGSPNYPVFYTRNQSTSDGGEGGALYLEVQENRLDAKFIGNSGTIRDQFTIMKGVNKNTTVNATVNIPVNLTASWIGGYNWYTTPFPPVTSMGSARSLAITAPAAGEYLYYVSDSISPKTTCIADTFMLRVTSALAVSVIKYDAILKNKKVLVQWTTSHEVESDFFTVDRSANGRDFETVMVITGKGDATTPTRYEFIDNNPLQGTGYYRLAATGKNGDKKIVGIKTVSNPAGASFSFTVKPNPAINHAIHTEIKSAKKQTLRVKVFNLNGMEVYNKNIEAIAGINKLKFTLAGGTYIATVEAAGGVKLTQKLIVK